MKSLTLIFVCCLLTTASFAQKMDNKKLDKIIRAEGNLIEGQPGFWSLDFHEFPMQIITDEKNNRMRIVGAIAYTKDIDKATYEEALRANFHTALDVKYAISDEIMWCVFIHPLKELSEDQFKDALQQVFFGAVTFGDGYTSTNLVFPGE